MRFTFFPLGCRLIKTNCSIRMNFDSNSPGFEPVLMMDSPSYDFVSESQIFHTSPCPENNIFGMPVLPHNNGTIV